MNWKLAGEIYGVFSKFCFMVDSDRYEVDEDLIDAYEAASNDLEDGIVNEEAICELLDFITDNTNCNYWVDFDEPLFFDDDEDIETSDGCSCEHCDNVDEEEIKHWTKMIGDALDEVSDKLSEKAPDTPIKLTITLSEGE